MSFIKEVSVENKLNEYNIFALRDLARRTGVKSPTSKKKDVLIREIMAIRSGKQAPQVEEKRQGRPPKTFAYNMSNVFSFMDEAEVSSLTFKQSDEEFVDGELITVAGILEPVNNNAGILWVFKNYKVDKYFVPASVMLKHNFKIGDSVVGKTTGEENQKIITDIFSVNNVPLVQLKNKRQSFSEIERALPNRKLNFKGGEFDSIALKKGENCYLYGCNNNNNTLTAVRLLNAVECEHKIYINISIAEKTKLLLKDLKNCEMYTCMITDSVDVSKRMIVLAIERIKRILEVKEDVVAVVDDMLSASSVDNDSLNLIKNLASLSCDTNKHGSITLMAIMPDSSLVQIEKLADVRMEISNQEIVKKL